MPNPAAVHFSGFEHVHFPSREKVENQLEAFLLGMKSIDNPTVRLVLGEWGEGKSEVFERFLKPREKSIGYSILYCTTSSICNAMESKHYERMATQEVRASVRFLSAVMIAIYHDNRNKGVFEDRHDPYHGRNCEEYVTRLISYCYEKSNGPILIFIDEFEEILGQDDLVITRFLSGLKEIINQQFDLISSLDSSHGKFAGKVHFMLACTPDAYHRLPREKVTSQIMGGLERRIGIIKLESITKRESVEFLHKLLDYYYKGDVPSQPPFASTGMYETLHRISLGNIGNLISIHAELLKRAAAQKDIDNDKMLVITPQLFIDWLMSIEISIYGAREMAISEKELSRILSAFAKSKQNQKARNLFYLLVSDTKPHNLESIRSQIPAIQGMDGLRRIMQLINSSLKTLGLPEGIAILSRVKEKYDINAILECLKDIFPITTQNNEVYYNIGTNLISENQLRNALFHRIDEEWTYLFPKSPQEFKKLFGNISEACAQNIKKIICNRMLENEQYIIMSDLLLNYIFPSPIPPGFEFIIDKTLRLEIWRNVSNRFGDLFENMAHYVFELLKEAYISELNTYKQIHGKNIVIADIKKADLKMRILLSASSPNITENTIDEINHEINQGKLIHVAILLTTGNIDGAAESKRRHYKLDKDEFGVERTKIIQMSPHVAKQIIAMFQLPKLKLDRTTLLQIKKYIITQELRINEVIENWLIEQKKIGFVLDNIYANIESKKMHELLRFYINNCGETLLPREAYENSIENFQRFQIYSTKTEFTPDLSLDELKNAMNALTNNGFLKKQGRKYKETLTPQEEMILRLLRAFPKSSIADIENRFVIKYSNKKVLTDLYLANLEYRGLINENNNQYNLVSYEHIDTMLNEKYARFCESTANDLDIWGIIYVSKKKDSKIIRINEMREKIIETHELLENIDDSNENCIITKKFLLLKLIDYYIKQIEPKIRLARSTGTQAVESINTGINKITQTLNNFQSSLKSIGIELAYEDMWEYKAAKDLKRQFNEEYEREITHYQTNDEDDTFFKFDSEDAADIGHNPKVRNLIKIKEQINHLLSSIESNCSRIKTLISRVNEELDGIDQKTRTIQISNTLEFSRKLKDKILQQVRNLELTEITGVVSNFEETEQLVKRNGDEIINKIRSMASLVDYLEQVRDKERKIIEELSKTDKLIKKVKQLSGGQPGDSDWDGRLNKLWNELAELREFVDNTNILNNAVTFISHSEQIINRIVGSNRELKNDIHKWWQKEYRKANQKIQILRHHIQRLISNLSELSEELTQVMHQLDAIGDILRSNVEDQDERNPLKTIYDYISSVEESMKNVCQKTLDDNQSELLLFLQSQIQQTEYEFISKNHFISEAVNKLKLDAETIHSILDELIERGLIDEYVSFRH